LTKSHSSVYMEIVEHPIIFKTKERLCVLWLWHASRSFRNTNQEKASEA